MFDMKFAEQRRKDLMAEAEQHRLAQQARAAQKRMPVFSPVLDIVGRQLIAWGQMLQLQASGRVKVVSIQGEAQALTGCECGCTA